MLVRDCNCIECCSPCTHLKPMFENVDNAHTWCQIPFLSIFCANHYVILKCPFVFTKDDYICDSDRSQQASTFLFPRKIVPEQFIHLFLQSYVIKLIIETERPLVNERKQGNGVFPE